MVDNAILLERVTHELSGDITHDPTKNRNPPKIDWFYTISKLFKMILMNGNNNTRDIWDPPTFTMVFLGYQTYNCNVRSSERLTHDDIKQNPKNRQFNQI